MLIYVKASYEICQKSRIPQVNDVVAEMCDEAAVLGEANTGAHPHLLHITHIFTGATEFNAFDMIDIFFLVRCNVL